MTSLSLAEFWGSFSVQSQGIFLAIASVSFVSGSSCTLDSRAYTIAMDVDRRSHHSNHIMAIVKIHVSPPLTTTRALDPEARASD